MHPSSTVDESSSPILRIDSPDDLNFMREVRCNELSTTGAQSVDSRKRSYNNELVEQNQPQVKRRKIEAPKILLKDLRADEFLDKLALYNSPMVTVLLDGGEFSLPRGLLCYNSEFFDRALNGYYEEAAQDYILLSGCSVDSFTLVIQWLYHAQIMLPSRETTSKGSHTTDVRESDIRDIPNGSYVDSDEEEAWMEVHESVEPRPRPKDTKAKQISRLLAFLKLADRIMLLGPFDNVLATIKELILSDRNCLTAEHIRSAAELPAAHGARKLFAQACFKDYISSLFSGTNKVAFKFDKELSELESFSSDLFQEFNYAVRERKYKEAHQYSSDRKGILVDPLDKKKLTCIIDARKGWPQIS